VAADGVEVAAETADVVAVEPESIETREPAVASEPDSEPTDPEPAAPAGELEIHFLDVGQGDATLLKHDEVAVLIDTGRHNASDVVPHLRAHGVDMLDLIVVTHPHADHLGQFDQIVDAVTVTEVWWSGSTATTQTFGRAVDALERSTAAYEEPRAGDTTSIGPLHFEVVNPAAGTDLGDLHDASLAFRITYGDVRLLFTGDAEEATEARMVAQYPGTLEAEIFQLGHHGSRTSTSAGFLSAVDPAVAIYSAAAANSYGHPHAEVLDRLGASGVEVYGTAVHGTVTVITDGAGWSITTSRAGAPATGGSGGRGGTTGGSGAQPSPPPPSPTGTAAPPPSTASDSCSAGQVDVNTAGLDGLQQIVHIGPDRAQQIVQLRPFAGVGAMTRISGIGPARLDDIRAQGVACAS
jgi:beta-lactamase superfamily II metal-dependent hydrolase